MRWVPTRDGRRFDLVALGEVMLRLDPGDSRIATTRSFNVWEGGGEYNVARALSWVFGLETAVVTALVDNEVGRLIEGLIAQGGVDRSFVTRRPFDGIGGEARNAINFVERGFGVRAALSCADRAHSATSQLVLGDVDWSAVFNSGVRWFHTGGVFASLSPTTAEIARDALMAARAAGIVTSFDLNYRSSLWAHRGGVQAASELNRELAGFVDVLFGNQEDFAVRLSRGGAQPDSQRARDPAAARKVLEELRAELPATRVFAATLRDATSASRNYWTAIAVDQDGFYVGAEHPQLEIYDRVGGGDSFASGLIFGLLDGRSLPHALELGIAHGALAMTTPGDASMATRAEVERLAGNATRPVVVER